MLRATAHIGHFTVSIGQLTEIRCPWCGRLQFKLQGATMLTYIQRKCDRCHRMVEVIGDAIVASVTHSLEGADR